MERSKSETLELPLTCELSAGAVEPLQLSYTECCNEPFRKRRLSSTARACKPKFDQDDETDAYVATVQEECWPEEHACGNLESSLGITDSYDESAKNEELEDISTVVDDDTTFRTLLCGLEMTSEDLQVTADIEKPIYPNARITNAASMLLIMTFAIVHKLSGEALKDLLSLIDIHCLVPHNLIQSLYKFKKYFNVLKHPIKKHHYCPNCCLLIESQCPSCPNLSCKESFISNYKPFFIEIPIEDQLKVLFNRNGFYNSLKHRFLRSKTNSNTIEDIYDSVRYQTHMQPGGFLSEQSNISLTWNTDGVPVFKSSKYNIWPLYFAINELPPQKRWCSDNVVLAGLWFGSNKPNMLTFLKPFTESISNLYTGIELYSPDIKANFFCRSMLLCGTCDLPAKAMVYNMTQFNGKYGCSHCLQKGESLETGLKGNVHVYPYIQNDPTGPQRTDEELEQHSHEAVASQKPVFGVKGPSWLSVVPDYNVIKGNVVDYMHCVLLGVTKMLLKLWFDSGHSKEIWYCGTKVDEADSRLLQIKPPLTITRTPRSIQQHRAYWKASEYRAWLLFYSVPIMLSILPQEYLAHHMLLVEAIYLLLQDVINHTEIKKAELLIQHYCFKVEFYYGKRFMTANLHHLLHLPQVVHDFGPLYSYSCFPYEGLNGQLLNCIKGTQHVEIQILETICISQSLPFIAQTHLRLGSEENDFYLRMTSVKHASERETPIGENHRALGTIKQVSSLSDPMHQQALLVITKSTHLGMFSRAAIGSCTFHSLQHTQTKKRNNYTVSYYQNNELHCGEILYFITDYTSIFAVITPFIDLQSIFPVDDITNCTVSHIHVYTNRSQTAVHVVKLSSVKLCVAMTFEKQPATIFIAQQPNNIEKD